MSRYLRTLAGPVLVVVGLVTALYLGPSTLLRSRASATWPTVEGRVLRSEVVEARKNGRAAWEPRVEYAYVVDGEEHVASEIWIAGGRSSSDAAFAEGVVARYPAGGTARVHYDPGHPSDAVLETGDSLRGWLMVLFGGSLAVIGGIWIARR